MSSDVGPRRHDLVTLAASWEGALAAPLPPAVLARVREWASRGRPLVASRRDPARPRAIALGLALPPVSSPRRVAVLVAPTAIARITPPLALRAALESGPAAWRAPLLALDADARRLGLAMRVFGSLAWQHLSGERYLTDRSDVDLLVRPRDGGDLARALDLLRPRAADATPRLDGEVLLPGGGIAWRELLAGAARLLMKAPAAVALEPRERALARLAEGGRP